MNMTDAAFTTLVEDSVKWLDLFKVLAPEKNEWLAALGAPTPQDVGT